MYIARLTSGNRARDHQPSIDHKSLFNTSPLQHAGNIDSFSIYNNSSPAFIIHHSEFNSVKHSSHLHQA
jgi:hypothetical protein